MTKAASDLLKLQLESLREHLWQIERHQIEIALLRHNVKELKDMIKGLKKHNG